MELNTELHARSWRHFSFHKTYLDLVQTAVEAVVFGHRHSKNAPPHSSFLSEHHPKHSPKIYIGRLTTI